MIKRKLTRAACGFRSSLPGLNKVRYSFLSIMLVSMLALGGCATSSTKSGVQRSDGTLHDIKRNDDLVLDIMFLECLSFLRDGEEPFASLPTFPATPEAIEHFDTLSPEETTLKHLFSTRYSVVWDERSCGLFTMVDSQEASLLGVDRSEFLTAVETRAMKNGLTEAGLSDFEYDSDFSPLKTIAWSEPERNGEYSISLVTMAAPGTPIKPEGPLVEIGIIGLSKRFHTNEVQTRPGGGQP